MASNTKWNIILVGESGVGKTSMMVRYVKNKFSQIYKATVVIDHLFKDVNVHGNDIKLQIWDSAGDEHYKSVAPQFFRKARGCILVYDLTRVTTFNKLSNWLAQFRSTNEEAPIIIVGNKSEDPNARAVARTVVRSYAEQNNIDFMECSALSGENVEQVFEALLEKICENTNRNRPPATNMMMDANSEESAHENPSTSSRPVTKQRNTISYEDQEEDVIRLEEPQKSSSVKPQKKSTCSC